MPLASSGARGLASTGRQASNLMGHGIGNPSRNIHIPAFVPRPASKPTASTAQTIFRQTRSFLSRFATLLTAPGKYATPAHMPAASRSFGYAAARSRSIQQGLSFTTRQALARPMWAPCLPKPPAIQRSTIEVGLGTARKFSTARPIFQSVADNIPIAGRAFWEPDWELKISEEKKRLILKRKEQKNKENKQTRKLVLHSSPKIAKTAAASISTSIDDVQPRELDHYFPIPAEATVTTYLLIPLAPTPTSRLPLPLSPPTHSSSHPLLPFSIISAVHRDHGTHALRVSTLFARLDTSGVLHQSGVTCSAFGDPSGLCSVVEVKFTGWTQDRVRGVLGELGTGWCVLEEVREDEEIKEQADMEEVMSNMSLTDISISPTPVEIDPSSSFVLPTLDFSTSFPAQTNIWTSPPSVSTPLSDLEFHNAWTRATSVASESDSDFEVDSSSDYDINGSAWGDSFSVSQPGASMPSSPGSGSEGWIGLGLSSQVSGRVQGLEDEMPEPREFLF
ncbi:unnamed protein product [Somion occarium]|uniref:Uncharacterized protein n=1 Tax=Somion occarium TaxID=3059160 RepID=A0ABP1D6C0_9APHY